ncbi:MAG: hypothetical protein ACTHL8_04975 [Burkholderiaceae bacterium]
MDTTLQQAAAERQHNLEAEHLVLRATLVELIRALPSEQLKSFAPRLSSALSELEAAHRGSELAYDGAMRTFKEAAQAMRDAAGY